MKKIISSALICAAFKASGIYPNAYDNQNNGGIVPPLYNNQYNGGNVYSPYDMNNPY